MELGKYNGRVVTTDNEGLTNRHISLIGASGSGKTVECQKLISSAVEQGATIIAFDMHGTLADDQIFWKYRDVFNSYSHEIDAQSNGIPCELFTPICYSDGIMEEPADTVGAVTDILSDVVQAGSIQRTELRHAVWHVYETDGYAENGLNSLDEAFRSAGNKTASVLREKLYPLISRKIFVAGQELLHQGKINIVRLSRFSLKTQEMIAELLLAYLWRLANAGQFKQHEIYVFIDECQNLPSGKESALAQILSEGRKFGINLILATQMILDGSASAVQQRITQCGLMLFFKPAANRISTTAKMIDSHLESEWGRCLRQLKVGEFIAVGSFMIEGKSKNGALKVSAVEEKSTQFPSGSEKQEWNQRGMVRMPGTILQGGE